MWVLRPLLVRVTDEINHEANRHGGARGEGGGGGSGEGPAGGVRVVEGPVRVEGGGVERVRGWRMDTEGCLRVEALICERSVDVLARA